METDLDLRPWFELREALKAQNERLRAALSQCAAPFATRPGTVASCQAEIGAEFQRRMDIAGAALEYEQNGDNK